MSFKMAELDQFLGHRMEDGGARKRGGILRSTHRDMEGTLNRALGVFRVIRLKKRATLTTANTTFTHNRLYVDSFIIQLTYRLASPPLVTVACLDNQTAAVLQ